MSTSQPSGPKRIEEAKTSSRQDHRSLVVTILAVFGIAFVVFFESYYAICHSVSWRDWGHLTAAAGTIYLLSSAAWNGRWGIRTTSTT